MGPWTLLAFLTVLLFFSKSCVVFCYPDGPPTSACIAGLPFHKKDGKAIPPQTSPSPFKIIVNATTYKPGDVINIKVDTDNAETFRGLFLQVRPVKKSNEDTVRDVPLGSYRRVLKNTQIMGCDVAVDTIGHADGYVKYNAEVNWISPLLMKNDIIVRATVLANFSTYWANVKSDVIRLEDVGPLPAEGLQRPWLREIITTVQKKDDKIAMEEAVKARFEKGLNGALDPDGNVMVHYVLELLPFEDSTMHGKPKLPPGFDIDENSEEVDNEPTDNDFDTTTALSAVDSFTGPDKTLHFTDSTSDDKNDSANGKTKPLTEISSKQGSHESKAEAYYEVLVKAVIGGDKVVADALEKLIE